MSNLPYVTLFNGELKLCEDREVTFFPLTPEGAEEFKAHFKSRSFDEVMCSSTIDFPEEFGATKEQMRMFGLWRD